MNCGKTISKLYIDMVFYNLFIRSFFNSTQLQKCVNESAHAHINSTCLFLITNECMNFPIPIRVLLCCWGIQKAGDIIFFQFGCANTATTTANKCGKCKQYPIVVSVWQCREQAGSRNCRLGTGCVLSASAKRKVQQAAPLNQQSENRKMPIRAEGSQLNGIVCERASSALGTGAEDQRPGDTPAK